MKILRFLFLAFFIVSCATAEVEDTRVVETYVFGSDESQKQSKQETLSVQEVQMEQFLEDNPDSVPETVLNSDYSDKKENSENSASKESVRKDEEIIIVEEDEKTSVSRQEETTIIQTEETEVKEDVFISQASGAASEEKREASPSPSVYEKMRIFFRNNTLYCVGLVSVVVFSIVLFITVCTRSSQHTVTKKKAVTKDKPEKRKKNKNKEVCENSVSSVPDTSSDSDDIKEDEFLRKLLGK